MTKSKPKHGLEMTKPACTRFLKKIINDPSVKINISFFTDKSEWGYGALCFVSFDNKTFTVKINRSLEKGRDLRDLLLHEAGHLKGENNHSKSKVENELSAQLWAIKRAKELKWTKISKRLQNRLKEKWSGYKWNSGYRVYILASRLAKKRKLI